uniref:Uncharacterized protein n=1 Tax=viral metagenome TaxID=1070528 RepID=A0A6H1ZRG2_9ZZZZ
MTLILATAAGCLLLAGAAHAQVASGDGARYLSWANRATGTTPADVSAARTTALTPTSNGMIPRRVAPSQAVSRPMMQPAAQPLPVSRGLTPASAWIGPRTVPAYASGSPDPIGYAMAETPAAPRAFAPPPAPVHAPEPPVAQPAPAADATPVDDPMAPRRDAPIFRLQRPGAPTSQSASTTAATPTSAQPGQLGARYYSVHRDAGRQPDPTPIPEPVYFDSVSVDLAEPPATESVGRDSLGRRRPVANEDPSLP